MEANVPSLLSWLSERESKKNKEAEFNVLVVHQNSTKLNSRGTTREYVHKITQVLDMKLQTLLESDSTA